MFDPKYCCLSSCLPIKVFYIYIAIRKGVSAVSTQGGMRVALTPVVRLASWYDSYNNDPQVTQIMFSWYVETIRQTPYSLSSSLHTSTYFFQPYEVPLGINPARVSEWWYQHLETLSPIRWIRTGQHAGDCELWAVTTKRRRNRKVSNTKRHVSSE